jgi:hypothetical protein
MPNTEMTTGFDDVYRVSDVLAMDTPPAETLYIEVFHEMTPILRFVQDGTIWYQGAFIPMYWAEVDGWYGGIDRYEVTLSQRVYVADATA